jgi:hypothetical protein
MAVCVPSWIHSPTGLASIEGRGGFREETIMRHLTAIVTALALLAVPGVALCGGHMVTAGSVDDRLSQRASQRQQDVLTLQRVLSTPAAASTTAALGTRIESVRAAVPALNDEELRDLATRAAALGSDPAAGYEPVVHDFLIVFLIVAIVVLVFDAVNS